MEQNMQPIIINNTAPNYDSCLEITKPTWIEATIFRHDANDFDGHCRNKIITIMQSIVRNMGKNLIYLDTDVLINRKSKHKFPIFFYDIMLTRMVNRGVDRTVNAGVIFIKANEKTYKFCEEWLKLEREYSWGGILYPEQQALHDLAFKAYDGLEAVSVGNLSEKIYNLENEDTATLIDEIKKYDPLMIHLKNKKWKSPIVLDYLKMSGIIDV